MLRSLTRCEGHDALPALCRFDVGIVCAKKANSLLRGIEFLADFIADFAASGVGSDGFQLVHQLSDSFQARKHISLFCIRQRHVRNCSRIVNFDRVNFIRKINPNCPGS